MFRKKTFFKYLRRLVICFMFLCIAFTTSSCLEATRSPITAKQDAIILGIDKENNQYKLTVLSLLLRSEESQKTASQKTVLYTVRGDSLFDTFRNYRAYNAKSFFSAYVDFVIIGEQAARDGLGKYLDLIIRDHDLKETSRIAIAQGSTASDFIKATNVQSTPLGDLLKSLSADAGAMSESSDVILLDYIQMLNSDKSALYLPCIQMVPYMEKAENDKGKLNANLNGYAIFNEDKLIGFVNGKMARGLNFIINKIKSGIIVVKDSNGDKVSLEIISSKSKIEIDYSKDMPSAKIKTVFTTNFAEYWGTDDPFTNEAMDYLVKEQEKVVKNEMDAIIQYLQSNKADVIGINDAIYHQHSIKSDDINDWKKIFSEMEISVELSSRINRTYNTKQPVGHKSEDK